VSKVIKGMLGMSYTTAPDELFDDVMQIIDHCEKNPF